MTPRLLRCPVPVLAAAAAGLLAAGLSAARSPWSGAVFVLLLAGAAWEDGRTGYISDVWSLALAAGGLSRWITGGSWPDLFAAGLLFLTLCVLARCGAAGGGDAPLAGAAALWLPWEGTLLFAWGACVLGGLAGAALLLMKRKRLRDGLPFAPFLCLSGGAAYVWSETLWTAWLSLW